jgi:hypothetical protein
MIRKYLAPVGLILALSLGLTYAQSINRALQVSQDSTGQIGYDNIQGSVFLPGHILTTTKVAPPPVLTGTNCTGGTFVGTDTAGTITGTSSAYTSCVVTFGTAYQTAPYCNVTWGTGPLAAMSWTTSTTALTITQTSTASTRINYICTSAS